MAVASAALDVSPRRDCSRQRWDELVQRPDVMGELGDEAVDVSMPQLEVRKESFSIGTVPADANRPFDPIPPRC
jgi:hypothetical protein|tara:strand:+ start:191 stop:412 length:222 start_codon:yes stop_codon:yes gene_type:complete